MLIINRNTVFQKRDEYGTPDMHICVAKAIGPSAISDQVILLMDKEQLIVLFINKFTNNIVQKVELRISEISDSVIKKGLLMSTWKFKGRKQKWTFRIEKILPLRLIQRDFIEFISTI